MQGDRHPTLAPHVRVGRQYMSAIGVIVLQNSSLYCEREIIESV
jgi:hypothetical protein